MLWHSEAKPCWNSMRHPIDSAEWRSLKNKWPEFDKNGRNVWLGIATDGFNPSATQSSNYSCWHVYTVPYNLNPSLRMKSEFQMLCLLIPGPRAPSKDIDVYLEPLVDELKQLWTEGVPTFDMDKKEHFTLRAMLLWGIHDLPAFGNLFGCVTHGYKACHVCAVETESERIGNKIVYTKYRRFLKNGHLYKALKHGRYKNIEDKKPPTRLTGSTLQRDKGYLWTSIYGKLIKLHYNHFGQF